MMPLDLATTFMSWQNVLRYDHILPKTFDSNFNFGRECGASVGPLESEAKNQHVQHQVPESEQVL